MADGGARAAHLVRVIVIAAFTARFDRVVAARDVRAYDRCAPLVAVTCDAPDSTFGRRHVAWRGVYRRLRVRKGKCARRGAFFSAGCTVAAPSDTESRVRPPCWARTRASSITRRPRRRRRRARPRRSPSPSNTLDRRGARHPAPVSLPAPGTRGACARRSAVRGADLAYDGLARYRRHMAIGVRGLMRVVLLLALVFGGSCRAEPRGAVRPAPPGPLDLLRLGVWGDYSGLCPKNYEYCHAGRRSTCCPVERGCCDDGSGPYCCSSPPDRERYWDRGGEDERLPRYDCDARDLTCSQGGQTICCGRSAGCCVDEDGPYCCSSSER